MNVDIDFFVLVLNAIVTYFCGSVILYNISTKRLHKHIFYYTWSLGFILYGTQLALRAYSLPVVFQIMSMFFAFILFMIGIWSFGHRKELLYAIIAVYLLIVPLTLLFFLGIVQERLGIVFGCTFEFLPVVIGVFYHRVIFGRIADKLVFGWSLLYLLNIFLWGNGWVLDGLAIFSKFILLLGIMDYEFIVLAERVRKGMTSQLPPIDIGTKKEGGLKLIIPSRSLYQIRRVEWIEKRVHENVEKGLSTYIFSFQDVISHKDLRRIKWINPEKIFIFLFTTSVEKAKKEFTVIPTGITEIGAALSEIIKNI